MTDKKDSFRYDVRLIHHHLRNGVLEAKDLQTHLASLPDSASHVEFITIEHELLGERQVRPKTFTELAFAPVDGATDEQPRSSNTD